MGRTAYKIQVPNKLTSESSYWIGFVYADGSIIQPRKATWQPSLSLYAHKRDRLHLEAFMDWLQCDRPLSKRSGRSVLSADITSKELVEWFENNGVHSNKSINGIPPAHLVDDHHFWRGVVDGDGSISMSKYGPHLHLCGTKDTIDAFIQFGITNGIGKDSKKGSKHSHSKVSYQVGYTCQPAIDMMRLLYPQEKILALPRKLAIVQSVLEGLDS